MTARRSGRTGGAGLRRLLAVTGGAAVALALVASGVVAAAADDDTEIDGNVTVTITDPSPSPTRTPVPPVPSEVPTSVTGAAALIGGVRQSVVRSPNADGTGIVVTVGGLTIELKARTASGGEVALDSDGAVLVQTDGSYLVSGSGFAAFSPASVAHYTDPTLLGTLTTDGSGAFSGSFPVPPAIAVGEHHVQLLGYTSAGSPAVITMGVRVKAAPVTTPPAISGPAGTVSYPGASTGSQTPVTVTQEPTSDDLGSGALDLGVFAVSALRATAVPTFDLQGGTVSLSMIVRNTSPEAFDATIAFRLDSLLGGAVAQVEGIGVPHIQPGESRLIAATFEPVGNWTLYRGYATFTPPEVVDNTALSPVSRQADVVVPPPAALPVLALLILVTLGILVWMLVTGRLQAMYAARRRGGDEDDEPPASTEQPDELVGSGAASR